MKAQRLFSRKPVRTMHEEVQHRLGGYPWRQFAREQKRRDRRTKRTQALTQLSLFGDVQ